MRIDVSSNCREFEELMKRRAQEAPQIIKKAIIEATTLVYLSSRSILVEKIYNQPIPTVVRKRGKDKGRAVPAWKRTSTLLRQERYYFRNSGADLEGLIDNNTPYALARHNLDRASRIDGKTRIARWREDAFKESGQRARDSFREAIRAGLVD